MKTKVLASAAILFWFCCSTAMAQWPHNTYGERNGWEVELGTRIMERPGTQNNLSLVTMVPNNNTVFTSNDASDLDMSAGADIRFQRKTCYDASWELRGFFNSWDSFETRSGNLRAPLFTPAALPALSRPNQFDYTYESDLFNFELNYKRAVRPGFTLMVGPRYTDLEELISIDSNFINPGIPAFAFDLDSVTETTNHMPGLGFGVEFRRPIVRELFFVGSLKGAILANFASTRTITTGTLINTPPVSTTVFEDHATSAAGIGELSARLHYDYVPGTISLYAGYEALWIDGVALAPAQLLSNVSGAPVLNTSTTSFQHGLVLGSMIRF